MKLHLQVKQLKAEKELLLEGLDEIRRYIFSEKFYQEPRVNIADIDLRINEIKNDLFRLEVEETM
jgi:aryl carrier-like protein